MSLPDRLTLETSDQNLGVALYAYTNKQAELIIKIGDHESTWQLKRWSHQCLGDDVWTIELARTVPL
jgi:hypothetical protein